MFIVSFMMFMWSICTRRSVLTSSFISFALLCSVLSLFWNSTLISGPGVGVADDKSDRPGNQNKSMYFFQKKNEIKIM